MRILFTYKGRYHVRDAVTIEHLSAIASLLGNETRLVYDQDIFGVTDNIYTNPFLNRVFSNDKAIVRKAASSLPEVVVFLDNFNRSRWNEKIASELKKVRPDTVTVVLVPWETQPDMHTAFDYYLIGEPEYTFEKFLSERVLSRKKGVYRFDGLADLNKLPLPDKGLFSAYINFHDSYLIYTSKGCPYECSYCEEAIYKKKFGECFFRRRSPEHVIAELEWAKTRFGIREVIYKDSVFAWDKGWLTKYLALYEKRVGVPYKCFGKAEAFDDEIASILKETGCYSVEFGVQTFNEKIKNGYLHRREPTRVLLDAFSICDRYSLRFDADHLFGIPGERIEDHIEAARIYMNLRSLNRIKCHNLVFYRAADIYEFAPTRVKDNRAYNADFFSSVSGDNIMLETNRIFQKYFKVLPLLPEGFNRFIIKRPGWKIFRLIPSFMIVALMAVLAFKHKDTRFKVYCMYYPKKIAHSILR